MVYYLTEDDQLVLAYDLSIQEKDSPDWWSIKVDAQTGEILERINWTVQCSYAEMQCHSMHSHDHSHDFSSGSAPASYNPDAYHVFAVPVESPSHGPRSIAIDPFDLISSPYGWHDTDGQAGAEYTITRGNNVHAQEDQNGNNGTGYSPNGGSNLDFDFPIDFTQAPSANMDASLTNLFYWNNLMHDIWYQYGFDEAAGNFQEDNYGNGGNGSDYVYADGLDGGGLNNANFGTPPDGSNPRMQMFLWSPNSSLFAEIDAPNEISGSINAVSAAFGPSAFDVSEDIVLADDGTSAPTEACSDLINDAAINGKIALIDRGNCEFGVKCLHAEEAGAVAVIICQNTGEPAFSMAPGTDGGSVTIPSVMISRQNCDSIKAYLPGVSISLNGISGNVNIDGDFDNGIIAHEYGHGISNRLTGGGSNSNCLSNNEQMGEGWSDYFGMVMTIEPGDQGNQGRGVGTYAISQSPLGGGIRPYPYSTDMGINPMTYNDIKTLSVPHGVGSVWCTMLWEMTWALIDTHGFDPDLYTGSGGNNIAMHLVTEALKLQPCSPGFVDGRDAILAADQALYNGQNECIIWAAFSKRGLGDGANQGNSTSRSDGIESFTPPTTCELLTIDKTASTDTLIAGETVTYTLSFENQTSATYTNLTIADTLIAPLSYVTNSATNGAVFANGAVSLTAATVPAFTDISFTFEALVDQTLSSVDSSFFDGAEAGIQNWISMATNQNAMPWKAVSSNPFSDLQSFFAENDGTRTDRILTTKHPLSLTANSELKFWHTYGTLSNFDGGRVFISTDNQATWTDLGPYFIQNGYNDYIENDPSIPAFGGTNNSGYIESIVDLSSFDQSEAFFQFISICSDNAPGFGWHVDDIAINNTQVRAQNVAYFEASPGIEESVRIFPAGVIHPATCSDGVLNGNEAAIDQGGDCDTEADCAFELNLSGTPDSIEVFNAETTISSNTLIELNSEYNALNICLENDFEVALGASFLGQINPCTSLTHQEDALLREETEDSSFENFYIGYINLQVPASGDYSLTYLLNGEQITEQMKLPKGDFTIRLERNFPIEITKVELKKIE